VVSTQQLAEATGRDLTKEIRHAVERHLAQPPRVVAPELDEASVVRPPGDKFGQRRRR
jgi:hypothetical protein